MGAFSLHPLLTALKVRVTAIHQQDDRLYLGTATGAIQVYSFDVSSENGESSSSHLPKVKLLKTHNLGKRAVDQIGVLKESGQLVVLSDSTVTMYRLSDLAKSGSTTLTQARSAHTFASTSYWSTTTPLVKKRSSSQIDRENVADREGKKLRDLLIVGCRKKVVVYGGGKGGLRDAWELSLPHSPRLIIIPSSTWIPSPSLPEIAHLFYSPQSSTLLHLRATSNQRLSVTDLPAATPPPAVNPASVTSPTNHTDIAGTDTASSSGISMGIGGMTALTGLGGYVGLGGKASVPVGIGMVGSEVLVAREDLGVFLSAEGSFTRKSSILWPSPPEALAFSNPFIYSATSIPTATSAPTTNASAQTVIQVHLAPTLNFRENVTFPKSASSSPAITALLPLHSNTSSTTSATGASSAGNVLVVSLPPDKAAVQTEGSSIWTLAAGDLGSQVDELVREGNVSHAVGLVEAVEPSGLSPERRLPHLKTLQALQQFALGQYQAAIDVFLSLDVNPALVVALYPSETISGKLHVSRESWMELFGAVDGAQLQPDTIASKVEKEEGSARSLLRNVAHLSLTKRSSVDIMRGEIKEDDKASLRSEESSSGPVLTETKLPRAALEALMYFLSDRRPKLISAIAALPSTLPAESALPPLSSLDPSDLHSLPSESFTELNAEQLLRVAQVIYTALIKVYLVARPVLVGSLCRIENWCDVQEVEGLLKEQKKFGDLIDLYQGKKMHSKALGMLHELATEEEDRLDRYTPTVRYLQKLGPTELPLILETSNWIFAEDPQAALQIFTADEPEVEALPRREVMQFLDKTDKDTCTGYLEHIIREFNENRTEFHDRLAELYLQKVVVASKTESDRFEAYTKLLDFLTMSTHYGPYRLLSKLSADSLPEARAILVGRMGDHEGALKIYVHKLKDYSAAEAYCVRTYAKDPDPHGVFLLLLRIYLRPAPSTDEPLLLMPALALIAKHGVRLDATQVLELLPPLVTMEDVRAFFIRTLRDGHAKTNDHVIVKHLVGARKEEVDRVLMDLQTKRVRVTDQRICPQCQKRLGQSAIAVHAPHGEVTHLHCKDVFSAQMAKIRG